MPTCWALPAIWQMWSMCSQIFSIFSPKSSGFEHAALLVDLDQDGKDELYVASDDQGELRRFTWKDGKPSKEVILSRKVPGAVLTWNLMPVPAEMLPAATAKPAGT